MSRPKPSPTSTRRAVAALLLAHLLAVVVLGACPRLHHWVHPDADDDGHDCAVVWMLHGGGETAATPTALPAMTQVCAMVHLPTPPAKFVPSVFAANGVDEHAPPPRHPR